MKNEICEKGLLSCILQECLSNGTHKAIPMLVPNDFTTTRPVFEAILKFYNENKEIDVVSVGMQCGNYDLVNEIFNMEASSQSWKRRFDEVKMYAEKRRIIKCATNLHKLDVEQCKSIDDLKGKAQDIIDENLNSKQYEPISYTNSYMDKFFEDIKLNGDRKLISTGFLQLNSKLSSGLTDCGLHPGLIIIGGISSLGKTAFTLQISDYISKRGTDVLFFSLEMSKLELISRSISRHLFSIDRQKYKNFGTLVVSRGKFQPETIPDLKRAVQEYEKTAQHLRIIEGNFTTSIDDIRQTVKQHITHTGNKPVVFIDYLQIVKGRGAGNDKQEIDFVSSELKRISRDFDISVIAISSLNRMSYGTTISFESFKESGSIEYCADVVMGLELSIVRELEQSDRKKENRDVVNRAKSDNPRKVTCTILKQRNGISYTQQDFEFYPVNNYFREVGSK